jgi:hypothetical protein
VNLQQHEVCGSPSNGGERRLFPIKKIAPILNQPSSSHARISFFEYAGGMDKTNSNRRNLRITLGILAIIPIGLLVYDLVFLRTRPGEDSIQEFAFMVFGIPILVLNYWAWYYPEMIESFWRGKRGS